MFADAPVEKLARGLAGGFIHQGEVLPDGAVRGEPSGHLPPTAFVNFLQNHDQIGNRANGERLISLADPAMLKVLTATLILSPQVPMLFMGEDYGERQPFSFFCDYGGDLARNAWANRLSEAEHFGGIPEGVTRMEELADPNDPAVFEASKLRWERRDNEASRDNRRMLRDLIAKRRAHIVPGLSPAIADAGRMLEAEAGVIAVDWHLYGRKLELRANLTVMENGCHRSPVPSSIANRRHWRKAVRAGLAIAFCPAWR
jgi:1,4-alpha-glucan branching enzyme